MIICSPAKRTQAKEEKRESERGRSGTGGEGDKDLWRDWSGQRWRARTERETKRVQQRDRSKRSWGKDEASAHLSFIPPATLKTGMRIYTRLQLLSLSISPPLFSF